ncbi:MAG: RNA polymerase subunit sigma-70 [Verrucomicrobiales bacterium]|nr:RNA polymerase subunit sigma-70 [Verrucomicrobiales bacterium]|tara:strand:- start:77 stop:598 length:522 start_codon:yes stop_codon:yes gene_type:complete
MDGAIGHKRFEDLVKEHHASLRVFVRSLGVAADWVDDLAQDAFVEAYRKLDTFDVNRDFGKWLRGIARNLVRNELRKENRHRRILHEGLTQHLLDLHEQDAPPYEPAQVEALRECMDRLPDRSRDLVHSRYREGRNATRLAEEFDMKTATVRQQLLRIRRQLHECIDNHLKEA